MEENKERIEELEKNIANWQEELDTVWNGKNTDVAEVERRNLKNLIDNAKKEIDELKGIEKSEENLQDPIELLEELKAEKDKNEREKSELERHLARLEEERENYASKKNSSYKDIYDEYTSQIDKIKEKLEKMEQEKEDEDKDRKIRTLTKGKMDVEKEINDIQKQISKKEKEIERKLRRKQEEIEDIEFGTEDAMEEKELSDGTKVKVPKINRLYKELDELKESLNKELDELKETLKEKEELRDEFEQFINELKGIEKEEKTEYTPEQNHEYTKYFHGQGDIKENDRDDRRANDEYFGFEGDRGKGGEETRKPEPDPVPPVPPTPPEPEPVPPTPPGPDPVPPVPPTPGSNLPVKSGLQVYNSVLQEIGYIKGTKAIKAHDWLNKFGLIGKAAAAGIRLFTGRKKEIKRIEEVLDGLDDQDLELMMDDYITKNNNTRTIIKHKHNDIFLRALKNKLERYRNEKEPGLIEIEQGLNELMEQRQEELKDATPEKMESILKSLALIGDAKSKITADRVALGDRIDTVERGREEKSLDKKDNIIGKTKANRDPDNREEIKKLAAIEAEMLRAEQRGDKAEATRLSYEMEKYEDSQTEFTYKLNGNRKASIGKFDAPISEVKRISQRRYIAPEVLHSVALVTGMTIAQVVNMMNQEAAINQGIEQFNNANGKTIADIQGMATKSTVDSAQKSLEADVLNIQTSGERFSEFAGNFAEQSPAYTGSDALSVGLTNKAAGQVQGFNPKSADTFGRLSEIFAKKSEITGTIGQDVAKNLGNAATGYYSNTANLITSSGVDHSISSLIEQSAAELNGAQAETYGFLSTLFGKISKLSPEELSKINLDLKALLLTLVPTASRTTKDIIEERGKKVEQEKKKKQEKEEQQEQDGNEK